MTHSDEVRKAARSIFDHAMSACTIEQAFISRVSVDSVGRLCVRSSQPPVEPIHLAGFRPILVVAIGKAAATMLISFLGRLPAGVGHKVSGVLVSPERPTKLPDGVTWFGGGHPLPNEASFAAARAILDLLAQAEAGSAFCLFLISGGASAMVELPLDPAISLEDTIALYRALVHSGATIAEINCVRKHLSAVKGGRLGLAASAMPNLSLLVSDVPPGCLDALASGPTLPDSSTVAECRGILERYHLEPHLPASVRAFFGSAALAETPKPGDFTARVCTLLSSEDLEAAAASHARKLGFDVVIDNRCDDWGYVEAATYLLDRLRELRRQYPRVCLISAGEVTVKVPPDASGVGGRNQHFALYAATQLQPEDPPIAILSAGSDGIDGNSEAAGGLLVTGDLTSREAADDALVRFDAGSLLQELGAAIVTGPTGNNLRDLRVLLAV